MESKETFDKQKTKLLNEVLGKNERIISLQGQVKEYEAELGVRHNVRSSSTMPTLQRLTKKSISSLDHQMSHEIADNEYRMLKMTQEMVDATSRFECSQC